MKITPEMIDAALDATDFAKSAASRKWMKKALTAALSASPSPVGDRDALIAPRGGIEPNWWEVSMKLRRELKALRKAAQKVVDETDSIHDSEPAPTKYRAPYGAITELRAALSASPEPVAVGGESLDAEREVISAKAREWAAHSASLSPGSSASVTFILFAEWVEARAALADKEHRRESGSPCYREGRE